MGSDCLPIFQTLRNTFFSHAGSCPSPEVFFYHGSNFPTIFLLEGDLWLIKRPPPRELSGGKAFKFLWETHARTDYDGRKHILFRKNALRASKEGRRLAKIDLAKIA